MYYLKFNYNMFLPSGVMLGTKLITQAGEEINNDIEIIGPN